MSNLDFDLAESISTTNASYFICIYILILVYCCFGLAIVCDVYFVPALQKLSYNIAGSTLMALGASVPELFASLIGVFVTEDDIGTGSIIGSSCFNLIAVPAACAFVASATFTKKLVISPVPVIRNSAFYAITMLVLLLIIKDNKVDIPEAVILLLFFVMYMAFMIFCAQSRGRPEVRPEGSLRSGASFSSSLSNSYVSTDSAIAECSNKKSNASRQQLLGDRQQVYGQFYFANATQGAHQLYGSGKQVATERTPLVGHNKENSNNKEKNWTRSCDQIAIPADHLLYPSLQPLSEQQQHLSESVSVDLGIAIKNSTCLLRKGPEVAETGNKLHLDGHGEEEHHGWLSSNWVLVPMLPITLCLRLLAPLKFKNTCWTIWTFLVSIALIGALTYVSVWMVHLFGQAVGVPETVAGMTILSWGTGIPELIASIVLIKKTAQADMAICNTIGSNVIDASFCLSLPWMIKCLLNRTEGLRPEVAIQSAALPWTSFTLLLSVVLLILVLKLHNWELSFSVGVWLMFTYVAFVAVATYLESSFAQSGLDLLAYI